MNFARSPFVYTGMAAVVLVPIAHIDGIDRFAELPQVLALHVVAFFGFGAWLYRNTWRRSPLVLPALVFLLAEVVSVTQSQSRVLSLIPISNHFAGFALFLSLSNGLKRKDLSPIFRAASLVAGLISLLGLMQFVGVGQSWVPTAGLPSGTLGHRNLAAAYLVGILPLTFWLVCRARNLKATLGWSLILGLEGAFLIATRSRGAWVGLAIGAGIAAAAAILVGHKVTGLIWHHPSRINGLLLAMLIAAGFSFMPANIGKGAGEAMWHGKARMSDALTSVVAHDGDKSRLILWQHTAEMIAAYPILGVGAGNWRVMYPVFAQGDLMHPQTVPIRPHNDLLAIWSETGILGAAGFVALLVFVLRLLWAAAKTPSDGIVWALIGCLVAVVVSGLFGFSRVFPGAWIPFWLVVVGAGILKPDEPEKRSGLRYGILLGLLVLVAGGAQVVRQIRFDKHYLQTRIAFAQKSWPDVIDSATRATQFGQFNEEAMVMRGRAFAESGQTLKALTDYRAGLAMHPHSVGLWNGVGNTLRSIGQTDGARQSYLEALKFDPASGESFNNLGTLYASEDKLDSALALYDKAISYAVDLRPIYANMSIVYRRMGQIEMALEAAEKALSLDPEYVEALVARGNAYLSTKHFDESALDFAHVLTLSPELIQVYFSLAQAHDGLGDPVKAAASYRKFLALWSGSDLPQVQFSKRRLDELSSP
jgi:Tfp pilus assembly protein PilF/O-antigen ligase